MQKKESVSEIVSRNKISEVSVFKGVNILPRFMQKQIEKYEIYVILTIKKKKKMRQEVGVCKQGSLVYSPYPGFPLKWRLSFILITYNKQTNKKSGPHQ